MHKNKERDARDRRKTVFVLLVEMEKKRLVEGILIAIEGIDGAGKTTQAKILYDKLVEEGYSVSLFHEPTSGKWGRKIAELVRNGRRKTDPIQEFELFFLDRKEDVEKNIRPALNDKKIVIMDRYYLSNVAYQSVLGLSADSIQNENEKAFPIPTISIILDLSPRVALSRIRKVRNSTPNHFEREKYLSNVRKVFLQRFSGKKNIVVIEGNAKSTIDEIASQILNIVRPIIRAKEEKL